MSLSQQVDLAEGLLRGFGLTEHFARFVVFCGHASRSSNNPLAASLDCGACGGHSGEPNARFAAMLLNQQAVRKALGERKIHIPDDTVFVGALHETTNDHVEFFDLQSLPDSHLGDMEELREKVAFAGGATKNERANQLFLDDSNQRMASRSSDWSELRPEWGLAGNAAFVIAPRGLTCGIPLDGRAFLHSYDYEKDPTGAILEQIMTAPVVVANWINMQYYASMVDGDRFGSGNKTLHNVVGNFGLLVGSGGDLRTGLPWQSLHDGEEWRHQPLRLQVIAAAPRAQIETIVAKHPLLTDLFSGNWMHLIAIEGRSFYRFTRNRDGDLRTDRSPSGSSWELIDR